MANKRMFSINIVDSDDFLDMPLSAQCLYFHLNMRADDDGFINSHKKIMRMIGAREDDLKVLLAKRFILTFESGVIVIKHWRIHNSIRKDRYNQTLHTDERAKLGIKDNGSYTDTKTLLISGNQLATTGCPSIEENSIEENSNSDFVNDFDVFWNNYPCDSTQKGNKSEAYELYIKHRKLYSEEDLLKSLYGYAYVLKQDEWRKPLHVRTYLRKKNPHFVDFIDIDLEQAPTHKTVKRCISCGIEYELNAVCCPGCQETDFDTKLVL